MSDPCHRFQKLMAALGDLSDPDRSALEQHLQSCVACRELERALLEDDRRLTAFAAATEGALPQLEDRIMSSIPSTQPAPKSRSPRLLRWALAAAAVIVLLFAFDVFDRGGTGSVVWADVIAQVEEATSFVCRRIEQSAGEPAIEIVEYRAAEHGIRQELYQHEQHVATQYVVPDDMALYAFIHRDHTYMVQQLDGEAIEQIRTQSNAREMVRGFREQDYEILGRRRIDGRMAEGIEITDPEGWDSIFERGSWRLWVDLETQWPVRLELEGFASGGKVHKTYTLRDFDWTPHLTADDFAFEIPEGYRKIADLGVIEATEEEAIAGLRAWSKLVGSGRYPSALSLATAIAEATEVLDDRHDGYTPEAGEDLNALFTIRGSCEFFQELDEGVYNGDRVTARHFDRVLMRWRLEDGGYRVVYGDLRAETVDGNRLAEIEGQ